MNALAAGLALGIAGSLHCVAMCGPLVLAAAPRGRRAAWYHAGRWSVYVAMGVAAGALGGAPQRGHGPDAIRRWARSVLAR